MTDFEHRLLHDVLNKQIDASFDVQSFIQECMKDAAAQTTAKALLAYGYIYGIFKFEGDEAKGFEIASELAQENASEAFALLGECYENGYGSEQDKQKAFECYQKAVEADDNNLLALCALGDAYLNGIGTTKDEKKGLALLKNAADKNCYSAILKLAGYYVAAENEEEAVAWVEKGAAAGDWVCQTSLGVCCLEGTGTPKDEQRAFKLISKVAVETDYGDALHWLGWFYETGTVVEKDAEQAELYYKKAVANGYEEKNEEERLYKAVQPRRMSRAQHREPTEGGGRQEQLRTLGAGHGEGREGHA